MNKITASLACLLIISSTPAFAQGKAMLPMVEATKGTNWEKPDSSTIGFIGTRCGVLFNSISGYFAGNAVKESEKKSAGDFKDRAEIFSFVGVYVDMNNNKKSKDAMAAQSQSLSKFYVDEMLSGKRLNNNVFTQLVESDVDFCVKQFPAFVHAYKIINGIPTK
jgi:hypothetical protein